MATTFDYRLYQIIELIIVSTLRYDYCKKAEIQERNSTLRTGEDQKVKVACAAPLQNSITNFLLIL